jgi:hypothetical protein
VSARDRWTVPPLWAGETVVIVATGPSVTQEAVDLCRSHARVVVINTSIRLAPWADLVYFADAQWYEAHQAEVDVFPGLKVTIASSNGVLPSNPDIRVVGCADEVDKTSNGLCLRPSLVRTGRNSGHQAINVCYHLGVSRILLLGFDCRTPKKGENRHWWGTGYGLRHEDPPTIYERNFLPRFRSLVEPLKEAGVEVINCTPGSALDCWPMIGLADALAGEGRKDDESILTTA